MHRPPTQRLSRREGFGEGVRVSWRFAITVPTNVSALPSAPRRLFRWWHAALVFVVANALSVLPAGFNGDEAFYNAFRLPAVAPPDWLFAPMWLVLNLTSLVALARVANAPERTWAHTAVLWLESLGWVLFAVSNIKKRDEQQRPQQAAGRESVLAEAQHEPQEGGPEGEAQQGDPDGGKGRRCHADQQEGPAPDGGEEKQVQDVAGFHATNRMRQRLAEDVNAFRAINILPPAIVRQSWSDKKCQVSVI